MKIEQSLVLVKPDGVERGLVGKIIGRFEDVGLKIVGLKMTGVDKTLAQQHYTQDLANRRGEKVRQTMVNLLASGPVVALVLEGVEAVELVRKMVGPTEPKAAPPGTIRGDFSHMSVAWADKRGLGLKNVIHASSSTAEAAKEIKVWFAASELVRYKTVAETHTHG